MLRSSEIGVLLGLVALATPTVFAKERDAKTVYCVPGRGDSWELQRFKPLIDPRAKTMFAEMTLAGPMLLEFRLRRFFKDSEVVYDYKYDATGRLNALDGSVKVYGAFGSWVGEANILPDADGTLPPVHVQFTRDNQRVPRPDDAADYVGRLNEAPLYRTVESVPCGAMLKEAEKMNATQE